MSKRFLAISTLLFATSSIAAGVLNDNDIPLLRDALKKNYTLELCRKDLPAASSETCQCLGEQMAKNLDTAKLKLCKRENYEDCVAAEFTAAKSSLSEKQIGDCKALTKEAVQSDVIKQPAEKADVSISQEEDDAHDESTTQQKTEESDDITSSDHASEEVVGN